MSQVTSSEFRVVGVLIYASGRPSTLQTHYGCILRHKHPEADPKQECDGNRREANADRMCKYVRQFQFRRMHTDPHKALARLCEAADKCN